MRLNSYFCPLRRRPDTRTGAEPLQSAEPKIQSNVALGDALGGAGAVHRPALGGAGH